MAEGKKDKRFVVVLTLDIKEIKDGEATDFFSNELKYTDIGYEGVVGIEQVLTEALAQLGDWGIMKAMDLGLSEQLSAMGFGEQVSAMAAKLPA